MGPLTSPSAGLRSMAWAIRKQRPARVSNEKASHSGRSPHAAQHSAQLPTRLLPTLSCGHEQSLAGSGHVPVGGSGAGDGPGAGAGGGPGGSPAQWIRPLAPGSLGSHVTLVPLWKLRL